MDSRLMTLIGIAVLVAIPAAASDATSGHDGVTLVGVPSGARIAWPSSAREREVNHARLRIERGVTIVAGARLHFMSGSRFDLGPGRSAIAVGPLKVCVTARPEETQR